MRMNINFGGSACIGYRVALIATTTRLRAQHFCLLFFCKLTKNFHGLLFEPAFYFSKGDKNKVIIDSLGACGMKLTLAYSSQRFTLAQLQ